MKNKPTKKKERKGNKIAFNYSQLYFKHYFHLLIVFAVRIKIVYIIVFAIKKNSKKMLKEKRRNT